jgi:type II secretory pathway predicted ATPase ExeA
VYETHFGLREKPFSLIPDPDFLYLGRGHRVALSLLQYGVSDQTGFVVITGEVGSGKTTLVRKLLQTAPKDLTVGLISNTHASLGDLMTWILKAYDLPATRGSKSDRYHCFVDFLVAQYAAGKRTILIIDEAQNLKPALLEEVRMLSNVNADKHFVLQLILVGQPELKETLKRKNLRQFAQRISVFHDLTALGPEDTAGYIRHRLGVAGGAPELFDEDACAAVHHYTVGTPRLINVLCDLALVHAYADERQSVNIDTVIDAVDARHSGGLIMFRVDAEELSRDARKDAILGARRPPSSAPATRSRATG